MSNVLQSIKGDDWRSMAEIYKKLTEGTSVKPITVMLERMNTMLPFSKATGIYDNGTGPGQVISRIISDYGSIIPPSASLSCSDFASPMIEQVRNLKAEKIAEDPESPWGRLDTEVRNAMDLQGVADESQSHVSAGWVYFMTADPQKCLAESKRILKSDGVLCCSSWMTSEWMELLQLLKNVRPDVQMPSIPTEWASVPALKTEFERAGFRDAEAEEVEVTMTFDSYNAFADVMLLKMPIVVSLTKDFSEDERATLRRLVLEEMQRVAPTEPGTMRGTALVVTGRK